MTYEDFYSEYFQNNYDPQEKAPNHREAVSRSADSYAREMVDRREAGEFDEEE